ncbi:MAG: CBS domain-containing protein [Planctomycetes bacterium]|nr:CBS domain-containing protein [Planctomycetota bacterium]
MNYLCESLMTPVYETCLDTDPVSRAAQIMRRQGTNFVAVTEPTHRVVTVLTDRDIAVRALAAGLPADTPIRTIMPRQELVTVMPEDTLQTAKHKMIQARASRVLVTGRYGIVLGVINRSDIVKHEQSLRADTQRVSSGNDRYRRVGVAS